MLLYNYLLFDAAKAGMELYTAIELNKNYRSLYKDSEHEDLPGIAPYLFAIKENTPFAEWYFTHGWNQNWGTLLFANAAFDDVYRHFKKFLQVKTEDGNQYYFRFYDPRVLRVFLPTCEPLQLKDIFGPVRHFITESENKTGSLQFWLENTTLKTKTIPLEDEKEETQTQPPSTDRRETEVKTPVSKKEPTEEAPKQDKPKKKWDFEFD